ncbi:hypothetical protein Hanom_Chr12g01129411 [Helianthus anomalus]
MFLASFTQHLDTNKLQICFNKEIKYMHNLESINMLHKNMGNSGIHKACASWTLLFPKKKKYASYVA